MALEAPKYWPQIQALREAERKAREESAARIAQERQESPQQLRTQSVKIVESILGELVENDPILQKVPLRDIRKIQTNYRGQETVLAENADPADVDRIQVRWGNKFELTPEEQAILTKYEYRPIKPSLQIPEPPQHIIVEDHYYFNVDFHTDFLAIQHDRASVGYQELVRDQGRLLATVNACVEYPPYRANYTKARGEHYWKDQTSAPTLGNRVGNFMGKFVNRAVSQR